MPQIGVKKEPYKTNGSITVSGGVNRTPIENLVDTGTSTNMIRSPVFDKLNKMRKRMRYRGLLEAADNWYVSESATTHRKMAGIDN